MERLLPSVSASFIGSSAEAAKSCILLSVWQVNSPTPCAKSRKRGSNSVPLPIFTCNLFFKTTRYEIKSARSRMQNLPTWYSSKTESPKTEGPSQRVHSHKARSHKTHSHKARSHKARSHKARNHKARNHKARSHKARHRKSTSEKSSFSIYYDSRRANCK